LEPVADRGDVAPVALASPTCPSEASAKAEASVAPLGERRATS